jgi:hypothetical protein
LGRREGVTAPGLRTRAGGRLRFSPSSAGKTAVFSGKQSKGKNKRDKPDFLNHKNTPQCIYLIQIKAQAQDQGSIVGFEAATSINISY